MFLVFAKQLLGAVFSNMFSRCVARLAVAMALYVDARQMLGVSRWLPSIC